MDEYYFMNIDQTYRSIYIILGNGDSFDESQNKYMMAAKGLVGQLRSQGYSAFPTITCREDLGACPFTGDIQDPVTVVCLANLTRQQQFAVAEILTSDDYEVVHISGMRRSTSRTPFAYMLVGMPGAGKTTWRNLECESLTSRECNVSIISSDDLIEAHAIENGLTYSQAFDVLDFSKVEKQMWRNFEAAIARDDNIVIDRTNLSTRARSNWLRSLPRRYRVVAIDFDYAKSEIEMRQSARIDRNIPDEVIARMWASYVPPSEVEGFSSIVSAPDLRLYHSEVESEFA